MTDSKLKTPLTTLDAYLETEEGKEWSRRALTISFENLLREQARQAEKVKIAQDRGLDPAYKDLVDIVFPSGFVLGAKTYEGETVYRVVGSPIAENNHVMGQVMVVAHAAQLGITIAERMMKDGHTRLVADVSEVRRAILKLPYGTVDYQTLRATLPPQADHDPHKTVYVTPPASNP